MTRIVPLKDELFAKLDEHLAKFGFRRKRGEQGYIRKVSFGRYLFHLAIIRHANDFDVTANVGLRVDAIEDAINAYRTSLSNDLKRKTYTIGVELGNLAFDGQRRWSVSSSDDRAPAERQV